MDIVMAESRSSSHAPFSHLIYNLVSANKIESMFSSSLGEGSMGLQYTKKREVSGLSVFPLGYLSATISLTLLKKNIKDKL
jgi:hypothetical protein